MIDNEHATASEQFSLAQSPFSEQLSSQTAQGERVAQGNVSVLLNQLTAVLENARPMPLSTSVLINKDEVLALVRELGASLPEELQAARWLLRERDETITKANHDGDAIVAAARSRAEQMVQRSEVVKEANRRAKRIVYLAEESARRLKLEAEDYCDQRLAAIESLLQKTAGALSAGRQRFQESRLPLKKKSEEPEDPTDVLYDQDLG